MKTFSKQLKQSLTLVAIVCGLVSPVFSQASVWAEPAPPSAPQPPPAGTTISIKLAQVKMVSRDLLLDHIFWARSLAASLMANNQEVYQASTQMVQENVKSIGQFSEAYIGAERSQQLINLLNEHNQIYVKFVEAVISGVSADIEASQKQLSASGEAIVTFLTEQNEFIKREELVPLFKQHAEQVIQQVQLLKAGEHSKEAHLWAEMKTQVYQLSDYIVDGLAKKYPDKF